MKIRLAALVLCPLISVLHATTVMADTTVHSLDAVPGAIKTQDARKLSDSGMSGAKQPDGFGTALPAGFSTPYLVQQLAPGQDPKRVVLAGAKPWPQRANAYVAMICLADTPEDAADAQQYARGQCESFDSSDSENRQVWFGVFDATGGGAPRLVARTETPVDTQTDWSDTDLDLPEALDAKDANDAKLAMPASWKLFDLAPYQIKSGEYAFGVRAGWSEGYAGGGGHFEALYLFRVDGKALRVVFARPMTFDKLIAGDWHKDGTRDHDEYDASNSLVILPGATDGFHDIQLRQQGGKWRRTFKWSSTAQMYR